MKEKNTVWIKIALFSLMAGGILTSAALVALQFDLKKLNTEHYTTQTYQITEAFQNIEIHIPEYNIRFLTSDSDDCNIVYHKKEQLFPSIQVEDNTLTIQAIEHGKWYDWLQFNLFGEEPEFFIYLPQKEYEALQINTRSGDIELAEAFTFNELNIKAISGNIYTTATAKERISAETVSGNIYLGDTSIQSGKLSSTSGQIRLSSINCNTLLDTSTVSGELEATDLTCSNFTMDSTSGNIFLENVSSTTIHLESVSGNIHLKNSDADTLRLQTISGDIEGTLLTEKIFLTDTRSGNIRVPSSLSGGKCEIKTTSGNIDISVK